MAATLASLWEKKKKVQPNPAINQVDHSLTEGPGGDSQANAKAFQAGESGNSCSRQCDKAADPVGSNRQTFRPEKKRKRAQLSGEQDANFDILQGSNGQLSAEDTIDAGRKVEQLKKILSDQQHNADNKGPMACAESSQVLGPDKTDTTSTKQGQADAECADAATSQQVVSGQTTAAPAAAAILAHNGSLSEVSEQAQASNKEHVLKQHQSQLTQCIQQAQAIKPMADLPCLIDGQLDRAQIAAWLVGNRLSRDKVVHLLWQQLQAHDASASQTEASLSNCVIDLATRKSFGIRGGAIHVVDPLEDEDDSHIWSWELRDAKVLPKAQRQQAQAVKKSLLKAQEHITALHQVCQQLESSATGKAAETRLQKALDKLDKIQQASLPVSAADNTRLQAQTTVGAAETHIAAETAPSDQSADRGSVGQRLLSGASDRADEQVVSQPGEEDMTDAHHGPAHVPTDQAVALPAKSKVEEASAHQLDPGACVASKDQVSADRRAQKDEAKARKEADKERAKAEKEQQRIAKDAEKEKLRAEKEVEKEKSRLDREAEKERVRQEKEAARKEKETQKEAEKNKQATGFGSEKVLKKSQNVFKSFFSAKKPDPAPMDGGAILSPPPAIRLHLAEASSNKEIEQQLAKPWSEDEVGQAFKDILAGWKAHSKPSRMKGLPPTWACKHDAAGRVQRSLQERYGQDYCPDVLSTRRKKLLWHWSHRDPAVCRPAYYGSWSKPAQKVSGRRFNVQEPELDYEVESDEDWEEPDDAEVLTDAEDFETEDEEESQADGFVVDDGYLSEGEGAPIDNDDFGAEVEEEVQSVLAASGAPLVERYTHQHSMLMLEAALEKARRAHRPLIITSLGNPSNDPAQICMDPSLLNALSMQVLDARVVVTVPPAPLQPQTKDSPDAKQDLKGSTAKVPAKDMLEQLLPDLITFLLTHPQVKSIKQVCLDFVEEHADQRVTKKWVHTKVKEVAERENGQWGISAQALADAGIEDVEDIRKSVQKQAELTAQPVPSKPGQAPGAGSGAKSARPAATASAPDAAPVASVSTMHRFLRKASGSPVKKTAPLSGPAKAAAPVCARASAPARPRKSSPIVVDLCTSPLLPARPAGSRPAAAPTAAGTADSADELGMMDISQSPVKQGRPGSEARTATASQPAATCSTKPMLGLALEGPVSGSADPYWQHLSDLIVQGAIAAEQADELRQVFAEDHYDKWRDRVPAYLLSALVKALSCPGLAAEVRAACTDCAFSIVRTLAMTLAGRCREEDPVSKVWSNNRASPPLASLAAIYADPLLLVGLQDCLTFANHSLNNLAQSAARLLCALLEVGLFASGPDSASKNEIIAPEFQSASEFRCKLAGDPAWSEFLLKSLGAVKKHFLAGYLCASLNYLIEDTCSRQILFADSEASTAITAALLAAASSTEVLGLAKYGLKALLTLWKTNQIADKEGSCTELLDSVWSVAWARVVDGIDTFGAKQAIVKLFALQMVEMLLQSAGGFKAYAAAEDSQKLHLDCAVEYQALHAKDADLKFLAGRVLFQLRPMTKE